MKKVSVTTLRDVCLNTIREAFNELKLETAPSAEKWEQFFVEIQPLVPIDTEDQCRFYLEFTQILIHLRVPTLIPPFPASELEKSNEQMTSALNKLEKIRNDTEKVLSIGRPPHSHKKSPYYEKIGKIIKDAQEAQFELNSYVQEFKRPKFTNRNYSVLGIRRMVEFFNSYLINKHFKISMLAKGLFEKQTSHGMYFPTPVKLSTNATAIVGLNVPEHAIRKCLKAQSIEERWLPDIMAQISPFRMDDSRSSSP